MTPKQFCKTLSQFFDELGEVLDHSRESLETSCKRHRKPPGKIAPEDTFLLFECSGEAPEWILTTMQVSKWKNLYPAVDIEQECRSAYGWIDANPTRRKTANGMTRFLNAWLSKCQNMGGSSSLQSKPLTAEDIFKP